MDDVYRRRCTALANMLTANPRRHDQTVWLVPESANECGTVGCIAGWAALAQLGLIEISDDGVMTIIDTNVMEQLVRDCLARSFSAEVDGRKWLGLRGVAAYRLFVMTNNFVQPEELAVEVLRRLGDGRLTEQDLAYGDHPLADINHELP